MMSRGESKNKNKGNPKKLSVTRPRSKSEVEKKTIWLGMVIKSARIDEKMTKIYWNPNPNPEWLFVMMSRGESKNENKRKNQENY